MSMYQEILQFRNANCRNCYKCVRNCPVKAVEVVDSHARIRDEECILCEQCTLVCQQNAKVEKNMLPEILKELERGREYVISIHPGFMVEYGSGSLEPLMQELSRLGFAHMEELAEAVPVVVEVYRSWMAEHRGQLQIASHCPVIVQLVHKHYPALKEALVPVASFMQAHARMLKEKYPQARVVALMPCIGSLSEQTEMGNAIDYVVTFHQLQHYFIRHEIFIKPLAQKEEPRKSRSVIMPGGLSRLLPDMEGIAKVAGDGMDMVIRLLDEASEGDYSDCFLDLYACREGCTGGPSFRNRKTRVLEMLIDTRRCADSYRDFTLPGTGVDLTRTFARIPAVMHEEFTEDQIREALMKLDKFDVEDELNCGACGYNTCRDKAIAILQGKAEETMCVPYMRERQETYANKIINAVPGLLVTVDYNLNVNTMNRKAQEFFCMSGKKKIIGEPVANIMDDFSIIEMISDRKGIAQDRVTLPDTGRTLDRVFTNDRKNRLILCMMKDITRENEEEHRLRQNQKAAAELADRLVEEQLRIVHEIAGLLGETAADTKVAVEKLKSTIMMEEDAHEEE